MYIITRNNRRFGKTIHTSYESARSHARRELRKMFKKGIIQQAVFDFSYLVYSNPTLRKYGFQVKQLAY